MNSTTQSRIEQNKRQRLKQWKKDNDLKLATWNVRSLLRPVGLRSLTSALRAAKHDITAVQETRWPGKDSVTSSDYKFYYSGEAIDSTREFGKIWQRLIGLEIKKRHGIFIGKYTKLRMVTVSNFTVYG